MTSIAPTLQGFFTERLVSQRHVSPRTVASYRDPLKLLLTFAQQATGKPPAALDRAGLDAELITAFLEHLQTGRHNTTRTRNLRLTAIRSLFTYAALRHPEHAALIQQVLAIPAKPISKQLISFLTRPRPTPCSPPATWPGGKAAATGRCSWRQRKPGCASPS
jgi:site-specific recombinase XerD